MESEESSESHQVFKSPNQDKQMDDFELPNLKVNDWRLCKMSNLLPE